MRGRGIAGGGLKAADDGRVLLFGGGNQYLGRAGRGAGGVAGNAFLQEKLYPLNNWLGVKAVAQAAVLQRVGDGDDGHALMMRHETAHDGVACVALQAGRGEIDCFVKPEPAFGPKRCEARIIPHCGRWVDHRCQSGGIGRDHAVFTETPFQPKSRNAKVGILVGHLQIAGVIGRFRYAPRDAQPRRIGLLPGDDGPCGLFQHRSHRRAHHQRRHQVLKHAARPGNQRRPRTDGRGGAAKAEPVPGLHITLGNRKQACQTRLGGKKIVAVGVQTVGGKVKADGQKLLVRVEKEAKVHLHRDRAAKRLDLGQHGGGGRLSKV